MRPRFRSYLRRERITCAKITGYLEQSERKLGKPETIRKSAGFRRHDADVLAPDSHGSGKFQAARIMMDKEWDRPTPPC